MLVTCFSTKLSDMFSIREFFVIAILVYGFREILMFVFEELCQEKCYTVLFPGNKYIRRNCVIGYFDLRIT